MRPERETGAGHETRSTIAMRDERRAAPRRAYAAFVRVVSADSTSFHPPHVLDHDFHFRRLGVGLRPYLCRRRCDLPDAVAPCGRLFTSTSIRQIVNRLFNARKPVLICAIDLQRSGRASAASFAARPSPPGPACAEAVAARRTPRDAAAERARVIQRPRAGGTGLDAPGKFSYEFRRRG